MTEDNRIPEIRAELASWHLDGPPVPRDVLNRIRAILDSAPPTPGPGCYPPADGWDGVSIVDPATPREDGVDHWRQSWETARVHRDYAKARLELRKLNDAMSRKNRVIAKRAAERDLALWLHAEAMWQRGESLRRLSTAMDQRGYQRDQIGDDDSRGEECDCADTGSDCHTVSAVATWFRASHMVRAALQGDQEVSRG